MGGVKPMGGVKEITWENKYKMCVSCSMGHKTMVADMETMN